MDDAARRVEPDMEVCTSSNGIICPGLRRAIDQAVVLTFNVRGLVVGYGSPFRAIPDRTTDGHQTFDLF